MATIMDGSFETGRVVTVQSYKAGPVDAARNFSPVKVARRIEELVQVPTLFMRAVVR